MTPDQDMKTPVSRALDKLANDLCSWYDHARRSAGTSHDRTSFTHARAVASSAEHLIRVVVRDEIQAWELLNQKDDVPPHHPPRKGFGDEAVEQALKMGLRKVRTFLGDLEEKL